VPVSITATAQVKVSNKEENLKVACQLFLSMDAWNIPRFRNQPSNWSDMTELQKTQHLEALDDYTSQSPTIQSCATQTLEGHQRAIMAAMTVEEIYMDRLKFSAGVQKAAAEDLAQMGISIVSYVSALVLTVSPRTHTDTSQAPPPHLLSSHSTNAPNLEIDPC
jgi:uncharacterized membrane protein YqiK